MLTHRASIVRTGIVLLALLAATASATTTDPTYAALREARPDGRTLAVSELTLERDAYRFRFRSGTFHLLAEVGGRTVGAVFLGDGDYLLQPATEMERRHLGIRFGKEDFEVLTDTFSEMVLLFTDRSAEEIAARASAAEGAPSPEALKVFERHLKRQKKDFRVNFHLRLLRDLLAVPTPEEGVFMAFVKGKKHPPALAAVDPLGAGELGLFVRLGDERTVFYVQDLDEGGFWYLSETQEEVDRGEARAIVPAADALHYEIDTEIVDRLGLRGTCTVRFLPLGYDQRVLSIQLLPKLRIEKAEFSIEGVTGWLEMPFIQEDWKEERGAAVVFPEPMPQGVPVLLRIVYAGEEILVDAGGKNYLVGARTTWYPNLGSFLDLATFDLTYRVPKGHQVLSVGRPVEVREEGGLRISRWRTDEEIRVAGFNYGIFKEVKRVDEETGLEVRVYTNPGTPDIIKQLNAIQDLRVPSGSGESAIKGVVGRVDTSQLAESALIDGINMARVGWKYFGPLPQKHVAISQQSQWGFGQSWPSLIYMPYLAFVPSVHRVQILGPRALSSDGIERLGYHEMAHQWWGHLLGWASYRDQWISEAFAEFSAGLAVHMTEGWKGYDKFWEDRRELILQKSPRSSIPNWQAGPISMGLRIGTRRAPGAYGIVIYRKGAFVLHMLRMMMWDSAAEEPDHLFIAMMRDFTATYTGKSPSTADFQRVVERHMLPQMNATGDGSMDWFFDQWVHGMELPRYESDLRVQAAGKGQFRVTGMVRQEEVSEDFLAMVPIYVDLGKGQLARLGALGLRGEAEQAVDFTIPLPKKPKRVLINAHHDILAR